MSDERAFNDNRHEHSRSDFVIKIRENEEKNVVKIVDEGIFESPWQNSDKSTQQDYWISDRSVHVERRRKIESFVEIILNIKRLI